MKKIVFAWLLISMCMLSLFSGAAYANVNFTNTSFSITNLPSLPFTADVGWGPSWTVSDIQEYLVLNSVDYGDAITAQRSPLFFGFQHVNSASYNASTNQILVYFTGKVLQASY